MKKNLISLFLLIYTNIVFASDNPHNAVYHGNQIFYNPIDATWSFEAPNTEESIDLTKTLIEGTGSCSSYSHPDGTLSFALATDYELINEGKLIIVDNNLFRYYKIFHNGKNFEQILLTDEEIKTVFPQAELYKMSWIDSDNKMWLHKPLFKKRTLLLVNDTDNFYHQFSCKCKKVQDPEIKGLITINRYGIFRFKHFGKRNGELTFYIR